MKKGCLIATAGVFVLIGAGVLAIYLLARQYETQPKQPGEAELWAAEEFIRAYRDREASGNTTEASDFALDYARTLRTSRQVLFTEGKAGTVKFTKGYFLTYCFVGEDSLAVIVHVPELRHYAEDAKVSLGEFAWMLATLGAHERFPHVRRLAVGLKGVLNYSTIYTGVVIHEDDPLKGIQQRHSAVSDEALWPFFASDRQEATKTIQETQ